jgi:hypothetical protein
MAKPTDKAASQKQPESRRGKSRYETPPRPARVVLPERPPREVDNEIVSILLGGNPADLGIPKPEEDSKAFSVGSPLPANQPADLPASEEIPFPASEKIAFPPISPNTRKPAQRVPPPTAYRSDASVKPVTRQKESQQSGDQQIVSFEDFVNRWRHGLRKGHFKVCEVLYQKTYAIGTTECITSFSELARLSGLKMRQCFNIISQLEALGFVERNRSLTSSNKKDQGSLIRFHLFPKK